MRLIAPIIFGLCVTFASLAQAEQWSKTFPITGNAALRVDTSDANIHVDTWDEHTIEARVTTARLKIGEGGVKVTERHSADSVELEVRLPHNVCILCVHSVRSPRVEIEIHMPREGRVNLRTGDGSIQLSNLKGDMDIQSSDGGLEIDSVDGSLKAHTGDGRIMAAGRFDSLQLSSGDGRIDARALAGSRITSSWDVHASDGSVTLQLPEAFAADLDLHTGDGHISLDLPVSMEGQLANNNIHGKLNGGGNPLTIHTGDGSIRLQKL